jgi:hypothetical protein
MRKQKTRQRWHNATKIKAAILLLCLLPALLLAPGATLAQDGGGGGGGGDDGGGMGGITSAIAGLAKLAIDLLIVIAGVLMAVGIATNFIQGQLSATFGNTMGLSNAWVRIFGVVACFIGVALAIPIANAIIDAVAGAGLNQTINIGPLQ